MPRPKVDSRLQNIEQGIEDIKEKLCQMHPCEPKETPNEETDS
jgi:hypothetical protein